MQMLNDRFRNEDIDSSGGKFLNIKPYYSGDASGKSKDVDEMSNSDIENGMNSNNDSGV